MDLQARPSWLLSRTLDYLDDLSEIQGGLHISLTIYPSHSWLGLTSIFSAPIIMSAARSVPCLRLVLQSLNLLS